MNLRARCIVVVCLVFFLYPAIFSKSAYADTHSRSTSLVNQDLTLTLVDDYYPVEVFPANYAMDIEIVDFDNDGCKDAILSRLYNRQNKLYWNNCDGTWTEGAPFRTTSGWGLDTADFNGDGFLDIAWGNYGAGFGGTSQNYLYLNNGDRSFTEQAQFGSGATTDLYIQDVNTDSLPDVVVPNAGLCYIYTNNGNGTFTPTSYFTSVNTMNLDFFDLDKDGDLDALKSEYSGWSTYKINNGGGNYTSYNITSSVTSDMDPIDYDKDNDWDFVVAKNGQNYLYVNNGDGTWTQTNQFGLNWSNEINIQDLDNNGYDDVIIANGGFGASQQNYIYYNNGDGNFTEVAKFGAGSTYDLDFVDVDEDGDDDVSVANWVTPNYIYYNGYYPTTESHSYPLALPSDFQKWNYLEVTETLEGGTAIEYTIYTEDTDGDDNCTNGAVLLGPVSSTNNQVDLSSLSGVPICVHVAFSTSNPLHTGHLSQLKVNYETSGIDLDLSEEQSQSLGENTVTSSDNATVKWERPEDTSDIDRYIVHYREKGSDEWKTQTADEGDDSVDFEPGEGVYEWFLEVVYSDGSTSETSTYKFEIDETNPEDVDAVTVDENAGIPGVTLILSYNSPLTFNFGGSDGETYIELWDWDKTVHYDTMVCGSGPCDRGHKLIGRLTLVIYVQDEAGNKSGEREIKLSPFGFVAQYASAPTANVITTSTAESAVLGTTSFNRENSNSPTSSAGKQLTTENLGFVSGITPTFVDFPQTEPMPESPKQNIFQRIWNFISHKNFQ